MRTRTRHFHSGGDLETVFLLGLLGELHRAVEEWLDEEILGLVRRRVSL